MDDRQRQVQVGAGLQESRLNTDLIQWLEKYSSWILGILLVVVGSYFGWTRYQDMRARQLDEAFFEYAAARGDAGADGVLLGSPDSLLTIARDHDGRGAVWSLATMDAASIYLGAARRGLRPGADLAAPKPEDALTVEASTELLKTAQRLFADVRDRNQNSSEKGPIFMRALLGYAAASVSLGEVEPARKALEELIAFAEREKFQSQAAEARRRLERLPELAAAPKLYSEAELPAPPQPAMQNPSMPELIPMPEGFTPPGFDPDAEPQPVEQAPASEQPAGDD